MYFLYIFSRSTHKKRDMHTHKRKRRTERTSYAITFPAWSQNPCTCIPLWSQDLSTSLFRTDRQTMDIQSKQPPIPYFNPTPTPFALLLPLISPRLVQLQQYTATAVIGQGLGDTSFNQLKSSSSSNSCCLISSQYRPRFFFRLLWFPSWNIAHIHTLAFTENAKSKRHTT